MTKESSLIRTESEPQIVISLVNESQSSPILKARRQREYTNLERLEARLMRSRSAISEAKIRNQTQDSEYTPIGPMYWNAKAFHRYYSAYL